MIKSTDSTHVDSENLVKALLKIETVVTIVNEGARQAENVHKMLDLQGKFTSVKFKHLLRLWFLHFFLLLLFLISLALSRSQKINIIIPSRVLIKNGSMDLINASGERKKREFYLFNDSFLVAKTQGDDKLKHIAMVPFDMILINSITDSPGNKQKRIRRESGSAMTFLC